MTSKNSFQKSFRKDLSGPIGTRVEREVRTEPSASFASPTTVTTPGLANRMFAKCLLSEKPFTRDSFCDFAECHKKLYIKGGSSLTQPDVDRTKLVTVTSPLFGETAQVPPEGGAFRANGAELN